MRLLEIIQVSLCTINRITRAQTKGGLGFRKRRKTLVVPYKNPESDFQQTLVVWKSMCLSPGAVSRDIRPFPEYPWMPRFIARVRKIRSARVTNPSCVAVCV
jgi:hypothetical protein